MEKNINRIREKINCDGTVIAPAQIIPSTILAEKITPEKVAEVSATKKKKKGGMKFLDLD